MTILNLSRFILGHPLNAKGKIKAISRFLRWQLASRLMDQSIAIPFVGSTRLLMSRGMTGATGNWYCGLHELAEMALVLHCLRPGDLFGDIGANIGSYTVLAAGAAGAEAIAVEPIAGAFARLCDNVSLNGLRDRVNAYQLGVSREPGKLHFTTDRDTMNQVVEHPIEGRTTCVEVTTIDILFASRIPKLIKIDVEGHEPDIIRGGSDILSRIELKGVIMETNVLDDCQNSRYNILANSMSNFGFSPFSYDPFTRTFVPSDKRLQNTIFLRDQAEMEEICGTAPRFQLINGAI